MPFYTDAPGTFGHLIGGKNYVFEGEPVDQYTVRIIAPPEFKAAWPTIRPGDLIEVPGPARVLTENRTTRRE